MVRQITLDSSMFYCVLSICIFILAYLAEKTNRRTFAIAIVVVLSVVAGFRDYSVGRDTETYVKIFTFIVNGRGEQGAAITLTKDPGFGFLCKLLLSIWNNFSFLFWILALIIYGFIISRFWELRNKISFFLATFSFYSFYFFETMNTVRQFCGVAIVFWATRYLQKRRYIFFVFWVLIATGLFHKTSFLGMTYLIIELFSWKELDMRQKRLLIFLAGFGIIASGFIIKSMQESINAYQHYFNNLKSNVGLRVVALIIIFFVSLIFYHKTENQNGYMFSEQGANYLVRNTRIYYLLSCLLGAIGYFYDYMGRISYVYVFFQFVYFGLLAREQDWQCRRIMKAMIYVVVAYVLYNYIFHINGAWQHPYKFIWDENIFNY